jgi:hypothetical protein
MAKPFDTTVEKKMSAGYGLFELCQDEDVALADAWEGNDDELKVEPGRVGVVSAGTDHVPEIALASYTREPGPVADGYELVGQVQVEWETDHVELWTSASDIGEARQLTLPASSDGRHRLRAARAFSPQLKGLSLEDYLVEHPRKTRDVELWRFDFWPA